MEVFQMTVNLWLSMLFILYLFVRDEVMGGGCGNQPTVRRRFSNQPMRAFKLTETDQSLTWEMTKLLFLEVNLCE